MKAVTKYLIGAAGVAVAAGGFAAPAAAQYYPGYGYGGGTGNVIVGAILDSILRGGTQRGYGQYGYGGGYNYGNERAAIDQCARAAEVRLNRSGYGDYYGGGGYNNAGYRIAQIERVERKSYGMKVWGIATAGGYQGNYGAYGNYGYGNNYGYASGPDYRFNCEVDRYGRIRDIDLDRLSNRYGYRRY